MLLLLVVVFDDDDDAGEDVVLVVRGGYGFRTGGVVMGSGLGMGCGKMGAGKKKAEEGSRGWGFVQLLDDGDVIILSLYFDDIILTGSSISKIQAIMNTLAELFELKDMGKLTYFLVLHIQYQQDGSLFISQSKYAKELLVIAGMEHCNPTSTPSKPYTQLFVAERTPLSDPSHYRSLVAALQYLTFTCPDIAHSVNMVCQFMTNPTDLHFHLVKRILRYLKGTLNYGKREKVQKCDIKIQYISTDEQVANVFTRELHSPVFVKHCHALDLGSGSQSSSSKVDIVSPAIAPAL
ncbi:uncharacterized mitochondrial protein AtMg00810-like [Malus sylvestris]|uniref:uncharacterized mitochondrial protein AtMg00810-like n=1 Tax=Malus sylvestris TaxID=3752 RepID=UPI0021AC408B|nr:uncharacterized mitochondrial protein AtMg00810-like [Malus sylvestris]